MSSDGLDLRAAAARGTSEIASASAPILLVWDDYHVISLPDVHRFSEFWIQGLPPNAHLLITSRERIPIAGLFRLRARGEVTDFRQSDLRFADEETAAFMGYCAPAPGPGGSLAVNPGPVNSVSVNSVPVNSVPAEANDHLRSLVERAEGWPAGLRLLKSSRGVGPMLTHVPHPDGASYRDHLFEYLADDVIRDLDPRTNDFLVRSSVFSVLEPDVCDRAMGVNFSAEVLGDLNRRNLLISRLPIERPSFRLHPILRDFLLSRLGSRRGECHLAAGEMLWEAGRFREAVPHFIEAGAHARAARAILLPRRSCSTR